jgi:hypothetical protein
VTPDYSVQAYNWADDLPSQAGCASPPVDLHAVARLQRVKRAKLHLMIQRGVLVPVPGGFEVFLRAMESGELDLTALEKQGVLTTRQRLAFAHEVAHTFFYKYKGSNEVPVPTGDVNNTRKLENIVDRAAMHLLVPSNFLRREIKQKLGDYERIDSDFTRDMVARFNTSYEVMIDRLSVIEPDNAFSRCILLVRKNKGEALVTASFLGMGLLSILHTPTQNEPVVNWFPEFPQAIVESGGNGIWDVTVKGRKLMIKKVPLGRTGDFLLQVDDPGRRAPTSK